MSDNAMPNSMRIFVLALALAPFAFSVPDVIAAPVRAARKASTSRVVPRKKLAKARKIEVTSEVAAVDLDWHAPPGAPFEGARKVTPQAWVAKPAVLVVDGAYVRINAAPTQAEGFYFGDRGSIGIEVPGTAVGDKNLMLSCKGDLPDKVDAIVAIQSPAGYNMWTLGTFTPYQGREVAFVLVRDDIPPDSLISISIRASASSDDQHWRVDECSIQRVE